jgi:hypothetical protein
MLLPVIKAKVCAVAVAARQLLHTVILNVVDKHTLNALAAGTHNREHCTCLLLLS